MRLRLPILSFVLALVAGVGLVDLRTYITEWRSPGFTKEVASAMVGRRVEFLFWSDGFRNMKWQQHGEFCGSARVGEKGTVVGIKDYPRGYILLVSWDESCRGEQMFSHFGRENSRISHKMG